MRRSNFEKRKRALATKAAQLDATETKLDRAIDAARHAGAGLIGRSRILDDPKVRALMRHRDHLLRDMAKIRNRYRAFA